jgi:hypothetical protein
MAYETARSQIKEGIKALIVANGEENASWGETALAGTQACSDSVRRNQGIDGSVSVPRGEKGLPMFGR